MKLSQMLTNTEFVLLKIDGRIRIAGGSSEFYEGTETTVLKFNTQSTNSPPVSPTPPVLVRKNMLPGDLDGDGVVGYADLVIFTNNFGRTDGDTFNPNDLVEASLLPTTSTTPVTVTVYETITTYENYNRKYSTAPRRYSKTRCVGFVGD